MDVGAIIEAIREEVRPDESVAAAWLFGSFARGDAGPQSDVDVAILTFGEGPRRTLDDLPLDLEDRLGRRLERRAQVVDLRGAPDDLSHRVLRDGILVMDRDPALRVRFEIRSRNRYFDMIPVWRRYRAAGREA